MFFPVSASSFMRWFCCSIDASLADPLGNHSRFHVVMRILLGSVDSPSAEPTITDASKANMARFTEPRLYQFFIVVWSAKRAGFYRVKYWEIIADNLSKAGWSWGYVSALDHE
jgi:hypothetical protein